MLLKSKKYSFVTTNRHSFQGNEHFDVMEVNAHELERTSHSHLGRVGCMASFNVSVTDAAQQPQAQGLITPADLQERMCTSHLALSDQGVVDDCGDI